MVEYSRDSISLHLRPPLGNFLLVGPVLGQLSDSLQINTNSSLERVPEALQTLELLSQKLGTHMAMEAVKTANDLVSASLNQRREAVRNLENALACSVASGISPGSQTLPEDDWNMFLQPFDPNYFSNIPFPDMSQEGLC
jgi:hypothetical protein